MRARIQTMGIAEHEFDISLGPKVVKWLLYDVGGARGQVCWLCICMLESV